MVKIRFVVTGFASHRTWAEGYQRSANNNNDPPNVITPTSSTSTQHDIRLTIIPGDRWKFRMMAAAAELESHIALDDEIVVVDAMIDVTVLVALLKSNRPPHQCPRVFMYFHENQLTTPFTGQDRDYHKQHPTHWHYGMAHWRSLLVSDGCIFNSQTHLDAFSQALPKVLNEQCPRDAVEWQLVKCQDLLATKCTVLRYGLELDELVQLIMANHHGSVVDEKEENGGFPPAAPVILWNARLEEDKNPGDFLELLRHIPESIPFQLVVLGTDPSKGQMWLTQIQDEFGKHILHMGWCEDRAEYAKWLQKASIVVSTANHETFGISIVESMYCGALPLLPNRLSYPEILAASSLDGLRDDLFLYSSIQDAVNKLRKLLDMVTNDPAAYQKTQIAAKNAVSQFRWKVMGPVYNEFFSNLAKGASITGAGSRAAAMVQTLMVSIKDFANGGRGNDSELLLEDTATLSAIEITDVADSRVQLFRPKSLRNHDEYNRQWSKLREQGTEPALHGGRRATVRMLEAVLRGAKIQPISFLATKDLADSVLLPTKRAIIEKDSREDTKNVLLSAPIYVADKDLLNSIRGQKLNVGDAILAMVQFPVVSKLEDLLAHPPILILENVRNAENVGSILRTAFCLGITSIVASATAWAALKDSRAARCSMGTMYYHRYYKAASLETNESESLAQTIQEIQRATGIRVYGIEIGDEAKPIAPHGSDRNWAAVMGNEDVGLSTRVASACDQIVFIPQVHGDSLNVGHAAAIAMFELGRDCPPKEHDGLAACT